MAFHQKIPRARQSDQEAIPSLYVNRLWIVLLRRRREAEDLIEGQAPGGWNGANRGPTCGQCRNYRLMNDVQGVRQTWIPLTLRLQYVLS